MPLVLRCSGVRGIHDIVMHFMPVDLGHGSPYMCVWPLNHAQAGSPKELGSSPSPRL